MHQQIALLFSILLSTYPALAATQSSEDLGIIDFPNSGSPQSQPHLRRGVLLLHSFEYEDARQEFLRAQQADSDFSLAYMRASHIVETRDWGSNLLEDFERSDLGVKARSCLLFAQEAQAAYAEPLRRNPGRSLSLLGMALASHAAAPHTLAPAVNGLRENWKDGDPDFPTLPEMPSDGLGPNGSEGGGPQPAKLGTIFRFASDSDRFFFGGQPSLDDLAKLNEFGVRTVINLRSHQEMEQLDFDEETAAREAGFVYVHFPVTAADTNQEGLEDLFDILQDPASQPIFLHCRTSNRSGFIWALFKGLRGGHSENDALRQGKQAGLRSAPLKERARRLLSRGPKKENP